MKVDFILIGAQKSGTTNLAAQLAAHPQINFSSVKEPGYFNATNDWQAGLDKYHKLFNPQSGQRCGEASTMYTFLPEWTETHRRLYDYNPQLKLIYIMRQPVDRVISHYTHNLVRNLEKKSPQEAVFSDPRYINRSRYAVQIRPYLELFGLQQVLLLLFEEYVADQLAVLKHIADFLEIDAAGFADIDDPAQHRSVGEYYLKYPAVEKVVGSEGFQFVRRIIPPSIRQPIRYRFFSNRLNNKPDFPKQLRRTIWRLFADDVRAIEEILGQEIDEWRAEFVD